MDITVIGEDRRVEQIIDNLIVNAIRHASPDGWVRISVERSGADMCSISVSNSGASVPEDDRERIFEMFEQGHDRRGRVGLGLYLSRRLAEAQGGTLDLLTSARDTTFVMTLQTDEQSASVPVATRARHRLSSLQAEVQPT
jgi:signal transduction histidine kinase